MLAPINDEICPVMFGSGLKAQNLPFFQLLVCCVPSRKMVSSRRTLEIKKPPNIQRVYIQRVRSLNLNGCCV